MRVRHVMTQPAVTCSSLDTLEVAAGLMWDHECGSLPVVEDGQVVGIVTDRDICMAAYAENRRLSDIPVVRAMASSLVAHCHPEDTLAQAETKLATYQVRRLPVVDDAGAVVGVLSLDDLARVAVEQRGSKRPAVKSREIVDTLASVTERRIPD